MAASSSKVEESHPVESDEALNDEDPKKKKKRSSSRDVKDSKSRSRSKSKSKSASHDGKKSRSESRDEKRRTRSTSRSALDKHKKRSSSSKARKDKESSRERTRSKSSRREKKSTDEHATDDRRSRKGREGKDDSKERHKSRSRSRSKSAEKSETEEDKNRRRKMTAEQREKRSYAKSASKLRKDRESSDGRKSNVRGSLTAFLEEGREANPLADGDRSVLSSQSKYRRRRALSSGSASVFGGHINSREEVREKRRSRSSSGLLTAGSDKSIADRRKELREQRKSSAKSINRHRSDSRTRKSLLRKPDDETDTRPTTSTPLVPASQPADAPPDTSDAGKLSRKSSLTCSNGAEIPSGFPVAAVDKSALEAGEHISRTGEMPLLESTANIRKRQYLRSQENLENSQSTIGSETSNIRLRRRQASLALGSAETRKSRSRSPRKSRSRSPRKGAQKSPSQERNLALRDTTDAQHSLPVTPKPQQQTVTRADQESENTASETIHSHQEQEIQATPTSAKKKKAKRRSTWWNLGLDKEEKEQKKELEEDEREKALSVLGDAYNLSASQLSALKQEMENKSQEGAAAESMPDLQAETPKKKKGSGIMSKIKKFSTSSSKKAKDKAKKKSKESPTNEFPTKSSENLSMEESKGDSESLPTPESIDAVPSNDNVEDDQLANMLGLDSTDDLDDAPSIVNQAKATFDMMNSSVASLDPSLLSQAKSSKRISSMAEMFLEPTQEGAEGEESLKEEESPVGGTDSFRLATPKMTGESIVTFDSAQIQRAASILASPIAPSPHSRGSLSPHSSMYSTGSEKSLPSALKRKSGKLQLESPKKNARVSWVELTLENPGKLLIKTTDTDGKNERETKASVDTVASVDDLADDKKVNEALKSLEKDGHPDRSLDERPVLRRKKPISLDAAFKKDEKEKSKTRSDERTVGTTTTSNTNTSEATAKMSNTSKLNMLEPEKPSPPLSETRNDESITTADLTETVKSGSSSSLSRSSSKRLKDGAQGASSSALTKDDGKDNSSVKETRQPGRSSSARLKSAGTTVRSRRSRSESIDRSSSSRQAGNRIKYVPNDTSTDTGGDRSVGSQRSGRSHRSARSALSARSHRGNRSVAGQPSQFSGEPTHEDGKPTLEKKLSLEKDSSDASRRRKTSYLNRRNLMREEKAKSQNARSSVLSSLDTFLEKMGDEDDASINKEDGRSVHSDGPQKDRVRRHRSRRSSSDDRSVSSAPGLNGRQRLRSRTSSSDARRDGLAAKLRSLDVDF